MQPLFRYPHWKISSGNVSNLKPILLICAHSSDTKWRQQPPNGSSCDPEETRKTPVGGVTALWITAVFPISWSPFPFKSPAPSQSQPIVFSPPIKWGWSCKKFAKETFKLSLVVGRTLMENRGTRRSQANTNTFADVGKCSKTSRGVKVWWGQIWRHFWGAPQSEERKLGATKRAGFHEVKAGAVTDWDTRACWYKCSHPDNMTRLDRGLSASGQRASGLRVFFTLVMVVGSSGAPHEPGLWARRTNA